MGEGGREGKGGVESTRIESSRIESRFPPPKIEATVMTIFSPYLEYAGSGSPPSSSAFIPASGLHHIGKFLLLLYLTARARCRTGVA